MKYLEYLYYSLPLIFIILLIIPRTQKFLLKTFSKTAREKLERLESLQREKEKEERKLERIKKLKGKSPEK